MSPPKKCKLVCIFYEIFRTGMINGFYHKVLRCVAFRKNNLNLLDAGGTTKVVVKRHSLYR